MIKLIAFDLGQVLVKFDIMHAIKRIAPYSEMDMSLMPKKIFGKPLGIDLELGIISPETFFERLCQILQFKNNHTLTYEQFVPRFNDIFTLNTEMLQIMKQLAQTKDIGIISNTNLLHYDYIIKSYKFWDFIKYPVISFQVGVRKPARRIYEIMLNKSRRNPNEVLLIDDKQENISGACQAGYDAILFKDTVSFKEELAKRNLTV